jgi:hypothetical protein
MQTGGQNAVFLITVARGIEALIDSARDLCAPKTLMTESLNVGRGGLGGSAIRASGALRSCSTKASRT